MAGAVRKSLALVWLLALAWPLTAEAQSQDADWRPRFPPVVDTPFKKVPRPIIGALRQPLHELPQNDHFELIGYHPLPNPGDTIARGRNGPTGIAGDCLYVGSRIGRRPGTGPAFGTPPLPPEVLIVDISNPRRPRPVGALPTTLNATSRELRTIPDARTLIIMNFREVGPDSGAVNNYQVYDITDCRRPVLRQTISLGVDRPQEFFLWRDPREPARFLLYSSIHLGDVREPSLRVFELMAPPDGPISPEPVATFTLTPAVPRVQPVEPFEWRDDHFVFDTEKSAVQRNNVHSMSVSADGTRVYVANIHGGYYVLDSTRLANKEPCIRDTVTVDETSNTDPRLCLRKLNPHPDARVDFTPPYAWTEHSVYPVPGRPYLVISGERNGTNTCPWSWGHILDISNERRPQVVSRYMLPENLEANCVTGGPGDPSLLREFSPHQQLVFPNLFFVSWYSAGLRVWDIANPALPMEVGVYVPKPASRVVERFRDSPDVWMWPHPILYNGLIYITDENSGLYVLRYKGPRASELPRTGLFVSNTNYLAPPPLPPRPAAPASHRPFNPSEGPLEK
ncbi:LVIVD repeat-containing protein [Pyxidicoccus xibeiensis]|uniref:LVIVD repeat-containing protein n=1 Tax=Pyxidicoccus xibeiensis TaxID=2906759 RepID=UPI0020A81E93|nr:hypothetical protein [Pyxidicoccus xibeiensis]MCP3143960.1 hypothetical protein [Pyxidicoccus xibeiensis]